MNDLLSAIKDSFKTHDLITIWPFITQYREMLKFTDVIPDNEMIKENLWILQQYRKYIFSKQDQILSYGDDLQGMWAEVVSLQESAPEKAEDRKHLLYNVLRDQWLAELHQLIALAIESVERSE